MAKVVSRFFRTFFEAVALNPVLSSSEISFKSNLPVSRRSRSAVLRAAPVQRLLDARTNHLIYMPSKLLLVNSQRPSAAGVSSPMVVASPMVWFVGAWQFH